MCRFIVRIAVVLLLIAPFALGVYALVVAPGDRGTPGEPLSLDLPGEGAASPGQPDLVSARASAPEPAVPDPQGAAAEVEDVEPTAETPSSASPDAARLPGPSGLFFCRIVSARDGKPIPDAKVSVFVQDLGSTRCTTQRTTDATGLFMHPVGDAPVGNCWIEITPQGHESITLVPTRSHGSEAEALVLRVRGEAALVGRVTDRLGDPRPKTAIVVRSCTYPLDDEWRSRVRMPSRLTAEADQNGSYRVANLPSEETLRVTVESSDFRRVGGGDCIPLATRFVQLRPAEDRRLDFSLPNGSALSGTVLDRCGRPVPGTTVCVTSHYPSPLRSRSLRKFLTETDNTPPSAWRPTHVLARTVTDGAGKYRIRSLPAGDWYVGIARQGDGAAETPMTDRIASCSVPVSIAGDVPEVLQDLPAYRGLSMQVRVVDHVGAGVPGATVFAARQPVEDRIECHVWKETEENGAVRLGPLVAGEYEIGAFPPFDRPNLVSDAVVARDGDTDVTVRLPIGCAVSGRLLLPESPRWESSLSWVTAISRESGHETSAQQTVAEEYSFPALRPETYDLFVRTDRGYVGVCHGFRPIPG